MDEDITRVEIHCPYCDALFSIPLDYCGQAAECSECGMIFAMPTREEIERTLAREKEQGGSGDFPMLQSTNTVRVSRKAVAMGGSKLGKKR